MVRLEELTRIHAPIERCFDLARSVEVHLAGNIHYGEAAVATAGVTSGLIGLGEHVTWRAKHFGFWHELTSKITAMDRPLYFQDTMLRGIFQSMKHDHFFRSLSPDETEMPDKTEMPGEIEMKDVFCFTAPLGLLGQLTEIVLLRRYMRALLHERNEVIRNVAESTEWPKYLPALPETNK